MKFIIEILKTVAVILITPVVMLIVPIGVMKRVFSLAVAAH